MKVVRKLVILLGLAALLPFAASAKTPEQAYVENASKQPGVPVPVAVVSPRKVSAEYAGSTIRVAFTVDTAGTPTQLRVLSSPDHAIAQTVVDAVEQWRFAPATRNGEPVTTRVILPVHIADEGSRFASN